MKIGLGQKIIGVVVLNTILMFSIQGIDSALTIWDETDLSLKRYSDAVVGANGATIQQWLADSEALLKALDHENYGTDPVEADLQQTVDAGGFNSAYIARGGEFIQNTNTNEMPDTYDPTKRPWYIKAMKAGGEYVYVDPYINDSDKKVIFTLAKKLNDPIPTVLGADIAVDRAQHVLETMESDLSYGVIIDSTGIIMAHEDESMLIENISKLAPDLTVDLLKELDKPNNTIEPYETVINGETVFFTSQSMEKSGWYLALVMRKNVAYKGLYHLIYSMIGFATVLIICSIFIIFFFIRYLLKTLLATNAAIADLSKGEGDLTMRLEPKGSDEVADLAQNVNLFIAKLHTIISEIVSSGQKVNAQSLSFHDMAEQSKQSLAQQKDEVSQIATAVNEMSATAQEVANNAEATAEATVQSAERCAKGKDIILSNKDSITGLAREIDETSNAMNELEANTQNINNILVTIQGIAEQTNLLALNAAIEAARAGEQGRGFAVVADEVRVLSQRTQGSTEEIRSMIETLLANTDNAVQTMERSKSLTDKSVEQANEAVGALEDISDSIKKIADMSTQIASAAEEQRAVTEEVNKNTQSVSQSSDQMVLAAGEILEMSDQLGEVSKNLNEQVGLFKL